MAPSIALARKPTSALVELVGKIRVHVLLRTHAVPRFETFIVLLIKLNSFIHQENLISPRFLQRVFPAWFCRT